MSDLDDPVAASDAGGHPDGAPARPPADSEDLDRIVRWVLAALMPLLHDRNRATAAVSQALIDCKRSSRRRRIDDVAAWVLAVARKKALVPEERPSGTASLDDMRGGEVTPAVAPPTDTDVQRVERDLVVQLMRRTSFRGRQHQVLTLSLEGQSPAAIASRLEMTVAAVERSLASGCRRLLRTAEGSRFTPALQALVDRLLRRPPT